MASVIDEEDNNSVSCIEKRCEEESDVDAISLTDQESLMELQHCLLDVYGPSGGGDASETSQGSTGAVLKAGIYPTNSNRESTSSIDAVALKSTPASPHVTALNGVTRIEYIAKHSSALESVSDIIGHHTSICGDSAESSMNSETSDPIEDVEVSKAQKFFTNMISTLSFKSVNNPSLKVEKRDRGSSGKRIRVSSDVATESSRATVATIRVPSSADVTSSLSLTPPKGSSLCVAEPPLVPISDSHNRNINEKKKKGKPRETFADTSFVYAKEKRNDDFHKLFKSIADSERLIDDFCCALSREFLYQGRIYVTSDHICFNSNLLGWVTNLVIAFADITSFQKTSTAGLFPNGIAVITTAEKHYFASFLSRDSTYEFLETVKQAYNAKLKMLAKAPFLDMQLSTQHDDFFLKPINELMQVSSSDNKDSLVNGEEANLEDAIMSVDYVTPCGTIKDTRDRGSINDYSEDASDSEAASSDEEDESSEKEGKHVFKLKEGSGFYYDGPHYLYETSFSYYPEEHGEYVLAELQLDAPPGIIFELLFSETNTSFIRGFLTVQEGSHISHIPGFIEVNPDGQHFRKYRYTKALNFPVGPKSTKCLVQETVLHRDYKAYINVVNTTNTPDVPSGNSFSVKTRYMLRWASSTTSILKISFWVEWKGSSWIRSMIDKSCKSGQKEATKSLIGQIHEYLDKYVEMRHLSLEKAAACRQVEQVYVNEGFLHPRTTSPAKESRSSISSDGLSASSAISESLTAVPSSTSSTRLSWKYKMFLFLLVLISLLLFANLMFLVKLWSTMNYLQSSKESPNTCIGEKTLETLLKLVHSAVLDDMTHPSASASLHN